MARGPSHSGGAVSRRAALGLLGAGAVGFWLGPPRPARARARPNLVVMLCDDLGYGDLASYGHGQIRTPALDRLAGEGLKLTACYAAAPVCSPARAGLLTGRHPTRSGIYTWIRDGPIHLRPEELTLARMLREAGYATCHVGKWHLNGEFNSPTQPGPAEHGFEHWFATHNNAAPSHHDPVNFVRNGAPAGPLEGYSSLLVAEEGIRWLESGRDQNRPFFLHVAFHEPHEPIASPPALARGYDAEPEARRLYYANVENMDRAVGQILAALDRLGLAGDTLVFFTSDNGPETLDRYRGAARSYGSPGPLRGMKLHLYEGGIRVPGLLRWPGRTGPGTESAVPVSALDLLPTMADLLGIDVAGRALDGTSILPLLDGRELARATPLFWHFYRGMDGPKMALRDGRWKLVAHYDTTAFSPGGPLQPGDVERMRRARLARFELYDLEADLAETTDLAARHPGRVRSMAEQLRTLHAGILADGPNWYAEDGE